MMKGLRAALKIVDVFCPMTADRTMPVLWLISTQTKPFDLVHVLRFSRETRRGTMEYSEASVMGGGGVL